MAEHDATRRFELMALPHLDAAYNLARWLTGNPTDAEDVVQEAYLRAFRYFSSYRGGDVRVWLMAIVRNSFMTWAKENRSSRLVFQAEVAEDEAALDPRGSASSDPETVLMRHIDSETLSRLVQQIPPEFREVLVLREMEDLSYRQIADVIAAPVGTVMSRLARAREALRRLWQAETRTEATHGV